MSNVLPSISGRVIQPAFDTIRKLLATGEIARADLLRWLKPEDLPVVLEERPSPEPWHDIRPCGRALELLRDVVGGGSNDYLRERGEASAMHLLESGLYQQMEYLGRAQLREAPPEQRHAAFGRDLRLLATISRAVYNFTTWTTKVDAAHPRRWVLEISEAAALPDPFLYTGEGFTNRMSREAGLSDLWRTERVRSDFVVLRMQRDL